MKSVSVLALVAALEGWGGLSALAAERAPSATPPDCHTIEELKAKLGSGALKGAKFTALNAGAFHVLEGAWIAVPPPSGFPDADGAVLFQAKDKQIVFWMRGKCLSTSQPMPVTPRIVDALKTIAPATGEIAEPNSSKDEMKL